MMGDVAGHSFEQCGQRHRPGFRMDAPALKILGLQRSQNPSDLLTDQCDQEKFLFGIPLVVGQPSGEYFLVAAKQSRLVLGDHPLDPVGTDDLEVGQSGR